MRVIAGTYRSRALVSPPGLETRPTSDRLRETMFNILAARIDLRGIRFADLYAGTGAVGIEAISRGAAHTWFAETAPTPLKSLRANLAALKIGPASYTVEEKGAASLLARFDNLRLTMDVVFVDPPYEAEAEYTSTLSLLGKRGIAPTGLVVAECATRGKFTLAERYGQLTQTRLYKQGESTLAFYTLSPQ